MLDYGGAVCTDFILRPHVDVIGLVGKCKLFMDVANKMTSMICLGLTRMFFLSGVNYSRAMRFIPLNHGT